MVGAVGKRGRRVADADADAAAELERAAAQALEKEVGALMSVVSSIANIHELTPDPRQGIQGGRE